MKPAYTVSIIRKISWLKGFYFLSFCCLSLLTWSVSYTHLDVYKRQQPGDVILVAGKGHENYQEIKGVKHHFDDKEILNGTTLKTSASYLNVSVIY